MGVFTCVVLFLAAVFSYYKEKNIYNPAFLFNLYWFLIIGVSTLNLYNFRKIDTLVYEMVLFGTLAFNLGTAMPQIIFTGQKRAASYVDGKLTLNTYFWMAAGFLAIVDYAALTLIFNGSSISDIRYTLRESVFSSYMINLIFKFVIYPIVVAFIVHYISNVLTQRTLNGKELARALLLTIMDYVANGDRIIIYIWVVGILLAFMLLRREIKDTKQYRSFRKIAIVVFVLLILIFAGRKNAAGSFVSSIVSYYVGGLIYLTRAMYRIEPEAGQTIFVASYQGFFRPVMGVLELLGIKWNTFEMASDFLMTNQTHSYSIDVGAQRYFNYFTTCFGYFYYDFKMIGVVIHSFVFGFLAKNAYYGFHKKETRATGVYLFWIICIFLGMMNFAMAETSVSLGLVYYLFCFRKRKASTV